MQEGVSASGIGIQGLLLLVCGILRLLSNFGIFPGLRLIHSVWWASFDRATDTHGSFGYCYRRSYCFS